MSKSVIWNLKTPSNLNNELADDAGITHLQAQLLINRGISEKEAAHTFLNPQLASMADPLLLKGMDEALSIIVDALINGKKITIFGDYDADGLTSTALFLNSFTFLKAFIVLVP